ncbi:hypothetical protein C882_4206 [Caenispirillum salinarum AK4]|uniref:Uncharacterized protein n=1 Tax=Caenispirillum salinarum AK4 TaxID=1238182 RepID=K9H1C5_9PROT|nr:hypothetical protein C882_4206 [Caenispirillum salinarum AK4]
MTHRQIDRLVRPIWEARTPATRGGKHTRPGRPGAGRDPVRALALVRKGAYAPFPTSSERSE